MIRVWMFLNFPESKKARNEIIEGYQKDLVEVMGSFMPKIVRMCGDERFKEVD